MMFFEIFLDGYEDRTPPLLLQRWGVLLFWSRVVRAADEPEMTDVKRTLTECEIWMDEGGTR
jgi:hypothetical protein